MADPQVTLREGDVLIVTDMQNDFLPGGALAVPQGDSIIGALNNAVDAFVSAGLPVIMTRDWHPPDHCSFKSRGGPWPAHCVRGTAGADFSPLMHKPPDAIIISKAADPNEEQYSAFNGRDAAGRTLGENLRILKAARAFIGGVATEYCVFNTGKDILDKKYKLFVFTDGVKAIDVQQGDGEKALQELEKDGAVLIRTEDIRK